MNFPPRASERAGGAARWLAALAMAACGGNKVGGQVSGETEGIGPVGTTEADGDETSADQTGAAEGADPTAASQSAGHDDDGGADEGEPPINFDLGGLPDVPPGFGCTQGDDEGELEFSYIWISNSTQNTVSKINTQTLVEEGRYYTRPDLQGNPSRTSVNLSGDVAVANRSGGLTKYYADPAKCVDANGNGTIETSSGAGDILPWDDEECRAWHIPFNYTSHRPVAWTQGEWNASSCGYQNQKVWTTGVINGTTIEVDLVDGDLGVVEDSVMIPEVTPNFYGFYGGAVDAEGNFWASQLGGGQLIRVNLNDLTDYSLWTAPYGGYGMTVGKSGYVFTCDYQVGRFDPVTETWAGATVGGAGGCMEDSNGILWMANSPLVGVDVETLTPVYNWPLPQYVHGVSIDFDGSVWGVSMGTDAYKVDPTTGAVQTVSGLVGPYTYSDMTGFALSNVGGGGAPSG